MYLDRDGICAVDQEGVIFDVHRISYQASEELTMDHGAVDVCRVLGPRGAGRTDGQALGAE